MSQLEPLTVKEQEMAEQYFYLVDKFLKREHLDPNEYYDVVIFGYLQAIQRECRNPNPPEKKEHLRVDRGLHEAGGPYGMAMPIPGYAER